MPETDDLRAVLHERTAAVPHPPDRLAAVRRRVVRRQRRRAGGALAVLVTGAATAVLVAGAGSSGTHPERLDSRPSPDPGYASPTYYGGGRRIAEGTLVSLAAGGTSFTFTPTGWRLQVACTDRGPGPGGSAILAIAVNGHETAAGGCPSSFAAAPDQDQAFWSRLGVRLGRPSTVTAVLRTGYQSSSPAVPAGSRPRGTFAIAVYQRVPVGDYPLPPRPATLAPLAPARGAGAVDARDDRSGRHLRGGRTSCGARGPYRHRGARRDRGARPGPQSAGGWPWPCAGHGPPPAGATGDLGLDAERDHRRRQRRGAGPARPHGARGHAPRPHRGREPVHRPRLDRPHQPVALSRWSAVAAPRPRSRPIR